jgi:hypothetical protein
MSDATGFMSFHKAQRIGRVGLIYILRSLLHSLIKNGAS